MPWQILLNGSLKYYVIENVCHVHGTVTVLRLLLYVSILFVLQLCQIKKDRHTLLEKLVGSGKHQSF